MRRIYMVLLLLLGVCTYAQEKVSGTVEDSFGLAPEVEVFNETTKETVYTDSEGNFTMSMKDGDAITFTGIDGGMVTLIAGKDDFSQIKLGKDIKLNEMVAVGYGKIKKEDLTGSISVLKSKEIEKTPSSQVVQSLQSKVAGVQVSSQGSPGESPEIIIRGKNSFYGNSSPLFVVDGMFYDDIGFLSPNDIESVTVLKDASSSAIYGVRAANGVVLIKTKSGKLNKKTKIEYNGYTGYQRAQNVIQMASTEQFVNFALESGSASEIASVEDAMQRFGRSHINPNMPNVNTDWYKEVLRVAGIGSHDINVTGGSENISYSLGGNYFYQDGILDMKNSYERYNLRSNLSVKAADWLDIGGNFLYSNAIKYDDESSVWNSVFFAVPILPVYDYNYTTADPTPYSDARAIGYRSSQNPFPLMDNADRRGERAYFSANVFADIHLIPKKLSFKTNMAYSNRATNSRVVSLPYYIHDEYQRSIDESSISRSNSVTRDYIWDNVLTYQNTFNNHDLTLMAGTSFRDERNTYFGVSGYFDPQGSFVRDKEQTWYISNTSTDSRTAYDGGYKYYGVSYFGRASYKFMNKYILYTTFRAEGSSKYDETYVYLPAFGAAWVMSNEGFMDNLDWVDSFKLRAGWGRLANDAVPASDGGVSSSTVTTVFNDTYYTGTQIDTAIDNISWEYTDELDLGFSSVFFNNKLSLEFDYFDKNTNELVIPLTPILGNQVSYRNIGGVRNSGIEIAMGYKANITNDLKLNLNANFSTLKNEITDLYNMEYINRGSAEFRQRMSIGEPMDYFYGYVIDGVYQNVTEVQADPTAVAAINGGTDIQPGYFKYKDLNGDGIIDAEDRTSLGSPIPTYTFGGSIGVEYKNWSLAVDFYGQGGNVILNRNRGEVIWTQGLNIDADLAKNRWRGEGTTNAYPSSEGFRQTWNQKLSKFFLSDGDFIRIQNIQLAYDLKMDNFPKIHFTLTADRPFLWTKDYEGLSPEVGFDGIDRSTYPTPSTYTLGIGVSF